MPGREPKPTGAQPPRFRQDLAKGPFDAIVIGSGMGGLAAAAFLSRAGRRVLVLERHYMMGGFTHTFRRRQFRWDVGVHYVGEFHDQDSLPRLLVDDISDGSLEWAPMPPTYDRVIFPDATYDFVAGREAFVDELSRHFPSERDALDRYVETVDAAYAAAMRFFQHRALPPFLAPLTRPLMCRRFLRFSDRTTLDALQTLTGNQRLVGVLAGQWGTYGLPPATSSFGIHATVASHYLGGASYPVGGAGSIAGSILPTIEAAGGTLLLQAEVAEIVVRKGRAAGVRMADGSEISAPVVISDAGAVNTFGRLLPLEHRERHDLENRVASIPPSTAHVCLYVGLDQSARRLGLEATNLWIYPGYDHDASFRAARENPDLAPPTAYISFPSAKDPTWGDRHGDTATVEVIAFVPYQRFRKWEGTTWKRRGDSYGELKEQMSLQLLELLSEHVPQTRGHVAYHELSTPLSTRHFGNWQCGEIYGAAFTPDRFRNPLLQPRTPVPGLFLTGQDALVHGVVGALYSGLVAASAILGRNLIADVRRRRA